MIFIFKNLPPGVRGNAKTETKDMAKHRFAFPRKGEEMNVER